MFQKERNGEKFVMELQVFFLWPESNNPKKVIELPQPPWNQRRNNKLHQGDLMVVNKW